MKRFLLSPIRRLPTELLQIVFVRSPSPTKTRTFGELNVARDKLPLLKSRIWDHRDDRQINDVFKNAPALRRLALMASPSNSWHNSKPCGNGAAQRGAFLQSIAQTVSPTCARSPPTWIFPSFTPPFSLSTHLEMLCMHNWDATAADLLALLLVAPSLRMLHFPHARTVMVTPRFDTPLIPPARDEPFDDTVELQSLAELGVEAYDHVELQALIEGRGHRFDPLGIERARLRLEDIFDREAELAYLLPYIS
ncbi:hypothetical protein K438DRAFT_1968899 [Mycena galopus ATCC 62051]|nr:hypothetical protein K438DRAFT_1968899 [Mycena galopus ATCC 62051]